MLGSLLAFLKAENFAGKVKFIEELDGLNLMCKWVCECKEREDNKYGNKAQMRKIRLKLLQLLYDLCLNDDSIMPGGYHIRDTYCQHESLLTTLLSIIKNAAIQENQEY